MAVKGTKVLQAAKNSTVLSTYDGGGVAPASGHLSVYVDVDPLDAHREVEVCARLKEVMDKAREQNYNRPATTTLYYYLSMGSAKKDIGRTTDPTAIPNVLYAPAVGSALAFDDGVKTISPAIGAASFVSSGAIITLSGGGFVSGGFLSGYSVVVSGSTSNDGSYEVDTVAAESLTLLAGSLLTDEDSIDGTTFTMDTPALITDTEDSLVSEGFKEGKTLTVSGSTSNDGDYIPVSVEAGTITLEPGAIAVTEDGVNGVEISQAAQYVAVGIHSVVLSGGLGSIVIDSCCKEIVDFMRESGRLTK